MTNELGTTLSDIEAKADRKREALRSLYNMQISAENGVGSYEDYETIRKYIEEN